MPISDAMFQGDMVRRLGKLERKLEELTSGRRMEDASVGARGIRLVGSSIVAQDPQTSEIVARFGIDPETGQVGLVITDPDTGRDVSLSTLAFGMRSDIAWTREDIDPDAGPDIYNDLPGGPEVTVRVGESRMLRVTLGASFNNSNFSGTAGPDDASAKMSYAITGSDTRSPGDIISIGGWLQPNKSMSVGREFIVSDLEPGLMTVTAKYRGSLQTGGSGIPSVAGRTLSAQPL